MQKSSRTHGTPLIAHTHTTCRARGRRFATFFYVPPFPTHHVGRLIVSWFKLAPMHTITSRPRPSPLPCLDALYVLATTSDRLHNRFNLRNIGHLRIHLRPDRHGSFRKACPVTSTEPITETSHAMAGRTTPASPAKRCGCASQTNVLDNRNAPLVDRMPAQDDHLAHGGGRPKGCMHASALRRNPPRFRTPQCSRKTHP